LVADASKARFFKGKSPNSELSEFHDLVNEQIRRDEHDLVTDKEGRFHDNSSPNASGAPRSSAEPTARENSVDDFARSVAKYLNQQSNQGGFEHLAVVAEPKMLGRLRKEFASHTEQKVLEEVTKNLGKAREDEIREHLTRLPGGFK
jgi:protein required for attachment to host cells